MNTAIFLLISFLEWLALFSLTFALFQLPFKAYWAHLIFACLMLTQLSYSLFEMMNFAPYAPLIQLPVFIAFVWLLFRIPFLYAIMASSAGYIAYIVIQALIALFPVWVQAVSLVEVFSNRSLLYLIQSITFVASFLLSWAMLHYRFGFSFIPDVDMGGSSLNRLTWRIFTLIFIAFSTIAAFSFSNFQDILIVIFFMLSIVLGLLLYYFFQKEWSSEND